MLQDKFGFLLINKSPGPTSHDIIDELRKITNIKKIGHAGTLDPFASGLLIVAIGRSATKQISRFVKLDKEYLTTLRLGVETDTYDRTGKITQLPARTRASSRARRITNYSSFLFRLIRWTGRTGELRIAKIQKVLKNFVGQQKQVPPMYSAKKVKGKKLYKLARAGKEIAREPVEIEIYRLELVEYKWPLLTLKVKCSSGTYIRSLGHDIGKQLGTGAYLEELKRTAIGPHALSQAVQANRLSQNNWLNFLVEDINLEQDKIKP